MSINAYVGLQGSGKSFEVVSSVILDAVFSGRRVVTNVAGINEDRIHEYLVNKRSAEIDGLGPIVHVTNDRIMQPQFFPDEEKPELESVVLGGDLVAIDEAWRFWGTDNGKLSHEHMQFFRMHRHYVHPKTAVACDVVLMTQDITGLHRSVKNVIEYAFKMHKHKSLGFSKRYRVEIYEGWKLSARARIDDYQKKYDPHIFPLYQSYTGGEGTEKPIDKRQNLLASRALWFYATTVVLISLVGAYVGWRFFHPQPVRANAQVQVHEGKSVPSSLGVPASVLPAVSATWRVAGSVSVDGESWAVLADSLGRLRLESPSNFQARGYSVFGVLDGERVTHWSGTEKFIVSSVSGGQK